MDFEHSERARAYIDQVERFVRERVLPSERTYFDQLVHTDDWRQWRIPPVLEELKARGEGGRTVEPLPARRASTAPGLDNRDYAPIAEITGRSFLAPEVFNCSAPDTGNAEVLVRYGSDEQKERWLAPLLDGEIRSGFAMTEPAVASSDATNMKATCELDGDEIVLNGQKWWTSGAGDPRCKFLIFMGVTDPSAERHQRHSMVLVPIDTPGVKILRMVPVFGHLDEPHGHAEILFDDVRLPRSHFIAGPGRGFEVAQGRLGPGRIHHCMRAIGAAERALQRLCRARGRTHRLRQAAGEPRRQSRRHRQLPHGDRPGAAADAQGGLGAGPARRLRRADRHLGDQGGRAERAADGGRRRDPDPRRRGRRRSGADALMGMARVLRLADGPDEVHRGMVARLELRKYL